MVLHDDSRDHHDRDTGKVPHDDTGDRRHRHTGHHRDNGLGPGRVRLAPSAAGCYQPYFSSKDFASAVPPAAERRTASGRRCRGGHYLSLMERRERLARIKTAWFARLSEAIAWRRTPAS